MCRFLCHSRPYLVLLGLSEGAEDEVADEDKHSDDEKNDIGENKEEISMCLKQLEKSVQLNLQFSSKIRFKKCI